MLTMLILMLNLNTGLVDTGADLCPCAVQSLVEYDTQLK